MENTKIEWAHHTWNPWIGCTQVSPGCVNCYAEARDQRFAGGAHWGKGRPRLRTAYANWLMPQRWDKSAAARGVRERVFCASLADIFDPEVPRDWRQDAMEVIDACQNLDWLLLTKRPHLVRDLMREISNGNVSGFEHMPHVRIGTSVEDQPRADLRIRELVAIPAAGYFLSCEPLLGPVDIAKFLYRPASASEIPGHILNEVSGARSFEVPRKNLWVICGGESGPNARPMDPAWARSLRDQCAHAGTPFLFKQWGEYVPERNLPEDRISQLAPFNTKWRSFGGTNVVRVGKAEAGRLLDGRTHDEFPEAALLAA